MTQIDLPRVSDFCDFFIFSIMSKATDSQEKTLAAATILLLGQGFHGSALQTILATGEAPRRLALLPLSGGKREIGEAAPAACR
jgi:hypothetical protein